MPAILLMSGARLCVLQESPATFPQLRLGAPKAALPVVVSLGKATCAATIRVGLGYLEVPFVATMEARELAVAETSCRGLRLLALGIRLWGLSCLKVLVVATWALHELDVSRL